MAVQDLDGGYLIVIPYKHPQIQAPSGPNAVKLNLPPQDTKTINPCKLVNTKNYMDQVGNSSRRC